MNQTRMEQAAATSEAIILTLGLAATMEQTREQLATEPTEDAEQIIDTMMETIAVSLGALGIAGEA
tara:strand:- start:1210 stop:1407 length:198 start_codon:yes stop_codon:yes gene_type:complete